MKLLAEALLARARTLAREEGAFVLARQAITAGLTALASLTPLTPPTSLTSLTSLPSASVSASAQPQTQTQTQSPVCDGGGLVCLHKLEGDMRALEAELPADGGVCADSHADANPSAAAAAAAAAVRCKVRSLSLADAAYERALRLRPGEAALW